MQWITHDANRQLSFSWVTRAVSQNLGHADITECTIYDINYSYNECQNNAPIELGKSCPLVKMYFIIVFTNEISCINKGIRVLLRNLTLSQS